MVAMGQIHYRTGFGNRGGYGRTGPRGRERLAFEASARKDFPEAKKKPSVEVHLTAYR
jgi:hypothetical protein